MITRNTCLKIPAIKTLIQFLIIICLPIHLFARSGKFLFCYKFHPGEDLTYQTSRQDSIFFESSFEQTVRAVKIHMRQTLSAHPPFVDIDHVLSYRLDSIDVSPNWTSPLMADWDLYKQVPPQYPDSVVRMSTNGYPLSNGYYPITQFIIPLSEFPLERNEAWEFEFEIQENGYSAYHGKSIVFGHGMLFDFIRENDRILARFVVNTTRIFNGKCQFTSDSSPLNFDRKGEITATHLVYFDEKRGVITKIVTDQITNEQRDTASEHLSLTIKSKSTTELVDFR